MPRACLSFSCTFLKQWELKSLIYERHNVVGITINKRGSQGETFQLFTQRAYSRAIVQ